MASPGMELPINQRQPWWLQSRRAARAVSLDGVLPVTRGKSESVQLDLVAKYACPLLDFVLQPACMDGCSPNTLCCPKATRRSILPAFCCPSSRQSLSWQSHIASNPRPGTYPTCKSLHCIAFALLQIACGEKGSRGEPSQTHAQSRRASVKTARSCFLAYCRYK